MAHIDLLESVSFQSPSLYLQAAGSTGGDGTPPGIYLKWDLTNDLGELHLPKGNLASQGSYTTSAAYNRQNDFVSVYRTPYTSYAGTRLKIDLQAQPPASINTFADYVEWLYSDLELIPNDPTTAQELVIRFWNKTTYNALAASINPLTGGDDAYNFLQQYNDFIEIDLLDERSFVVTCYLELTGASPHCQFELVSRSKAEVAEDSIAHRGDYFPLSTSTSEQSIRVFGENIGYARWKSENCTPRYFSFELYDAYFNAVNAASNWEKIDDFSLSTDDLQVLTRLEDNSRYSIANWPHYNDGALVSYANYADRWGSTGGMKEGVVSYLENSIDENNLQANIDLPENGNANNVISISSLEMLKIAAMDFHIARMLGLGYIDTPGETNNASQVNYCIQFEYPHEQVAIPHASWYNFYQTSFTLEFWILPELDVDYDPLNRTKTLDELISKLTVNGTNQSTGWQVSITKGMNGTSLELYIEVTVFDENHTEIGFSCLLSGDAEWYHIVLECTGSSTTDWALFINNQSNPGRVDLFHNTLDDFDTGVEIVISGGYGAYRGCFDELRIYPRALSSNEIGTHYLAGRCSNADPNDVVGNWKFNEGEGVVAIDSSSKANNGVLTDFAPNRTEAGGGAWLPALCEDQHCTYILNFSNLYEKAVFPNTPPIDLVNQHFTLAFWFEPSIDEDFDPENPSHTLRTVLSKGDHDYTPGYTRGFYLRYTKAAINDGYQFYFEFRAKDSDTGAEFGFTTTIEVAGAWNFIVLRRSGPGISDWQLSVDDVLAPTRNEFNPSNQVNKLETTYGLHLGSQYGEIKGNVAHFVAYDTPLEDSEILQLFQKGRCRFNPPQNNLIGWWPFNEQQGAVVTDNTSFASDGALLQYSVLRTEPGGGAWLPSSCPCMAQDTSTAQYIYAAHYLTEKSIPDFSIPSGKSHVFMSLPTSYADERLPLVPASAPVQYGLYITGADGSSELITDPNGYAFYEDVRYINLNIEPYNQEEPFRELHLGSNIQRLTPFYNTAEQYTLSDFSFPLRIGVEYRINGAAAWDKPELLHDSSYFNDTSNGNPVEESVLIPRSSEPLFTHKEIATGIHDYALYGVNWFNRITAISNVITTDNTQFPKQNRLLPPISLTCQYIQPENPVILTSVNEQTMLSNRIAASNPDPYFTRMTFQWNQQHNMAYQFADEVHFFFKDGLPKSLQGKTHMITALPDNLFQVDTEAFTAYSTNPATLITPQIPTGEEGKYIGSLLTTQDGQAFEITAILSPGNNAPYPTFTVKGILERSTDSPGGDNSFSAYTNVITPAAGAQFLVVENLQNIANWDAQLTKTVAIPASVGSGTSIIQLEDYEETVTDESGTTTLHIGGVSGSATLNPITGFPGAYEVTFSLSLPPHPDTDITWYQGSLRFSNNFINYDPGDIRELAVWRIISLSPLAIVAYDADYQTHAAVMPGTVLPVNFHPGYRVYLYPETVLFNGDNILPVPGDGIKVTLMAACSVDSATSNVSSLTSPVQLQAREIIVPESPAPPSGGDYATRPDVYGKATYTFDCSINVTNRTPFGFVFYRANDNAVLSALYTQTTIDTIYASLAVLPEPTYINDYWRGLVNLDLDGSGLFKIYGTGTNTFRFPNPDKPIPNTSPVYFTGAPLTGDLATEGTLANAAKVAIQSAFVSLTEQPVLYPYLKTGFQTDNTAPKILDNSGQMLPPDMSPGALFDPYPMARKYTDAGATYVRFTDYTLDGAMYGSIYFYYGIEISPEWKKSDVAQISGPVQLLHTLPATAPTISSITVQVPDTTLNISAGIIFEVHPYSDSENIQSIAIYRTFDQDLSQSTSLMDLAAIIPVGQPVIDSFTGLTYPPFGEDIYYRLVALREITNELGMSENIPSLPSAVVTTGIIDSENPTAPALTATPGNTTPSELDNVLLSWPQAGYNATYFLYMLTAFSGNWQLLYQVTSDDVVMTYPADGVTFTGLVTEVMPTVDADGDPISYTFKVDVRTASGLLTLTDNPLTF